MNTHDERPEMLSDRLGYPAEVGDEDFARIQQARARSACCSTWDGNEPLGETALMRAVADGYPVTEGHALIYPKRHVGSFVELSDSELLEMLALVRQVYFNVPADGYTIAVNDGPAAGRTVPHLHVHVIPRRSGDVPDPRGGVRQLLLAGKPDPWIAEADK